MERLQTVIIDTVATSGLPFWVLDAIFSTPQLRTVQTGPSVCIPAAQDVAVPKHPRLTGPVAPLTSFRRPLSSYERYSQAPAEANFLRCLFKHIHRTLEVAEMSSDTAPVRAFRRNDWLCLRELVLRGGPPRFHPRAFMIENLLRMPNLRILKLELAHSQAGPSCICPPGWAGGCPWPNLEVLKISNPHADDEMYAHLPHTLQELTLCCFPRHYALEHSTWDAYNVDARSWGISLLTSDEMLRILHRCRTPLIRLRHLDIEFAASPTDTSLLHHIATAFPALTSLQFCRYRAALERDAASWVCTFNPYTCLR